MVNKRNRKILVITAGLLSFLMVLGLIILTLYIYIASAFAPKIILNGEEKITLEVFSEYHDEGALVQENKDTKIQASLFSYNVDTTKLGTYEVVYNASNKYGKRTRKVKRTVEVVDTTPPEITLNGGENVVVFQNQNYEDVGFVVMDQIDGDISGRVAISGELNTSVLGEYQLTYTVSDSSGNQSVAHRRVTVVPLPENYIAPEDIGKTPIYLTFDDGPSSETTPILLDVLARNNVKATFFVVGTMVDQNPEMLQRIAAEGHSIGMHSYTHNYQHIYTDDQNFLDEMTMLQIKIQELTGIQTNIFRFPGGTSNTISRKYNPGIMTRLFNITRDQGLFSFDWNIDSGDGMVRDLPTESILANLVVGLEKPRELHIPLMHDTNKNVNLAQAIEQFIVYAKENGYRFDKITSQTPAVITTLAN